jgi:hypothetical protein
MQLPHKVSGLVVAAAESPERAAQNLPDRQR